MNNSRSGLIELIFTNKLAVILIIVMSIFIGIASYYYKKSNPTVILQTAFNVVGVDKKEVSQIILSHSFLKNIVVDLGLPNVFQLEGEFNEDAATNIIKDSLVLQNPLETKPYRYELGLSWDLEPELGIRILNRINSELDLYVKNIELDSSRISGDIPYKYSYIVLPLYSEGNFPNNYLAFRKIFSMPEVLSHMNNEFPEYGIKGNELYTGKLILGMGNIPRVSVKLDDFAVNIGLNDQQFYIMNNERKISHGLIRAFANSYDKLDVEKINDYLNVHLIKYITSISQSVLVKNSILELINDTDFLKKFKIENHLIRNCIVVEITAFNEINIFIESGARKTNLAIAEHIKENLSKVLKKRNLSAEFVSEDGSFFQFKNKIQVHKNAIKDKLATTEYRFELIDKPYFLKYASDKYGLPFIVVAYLLLGMIVSILYVSVINSIKKSKT